MSILNTLFGNKDQDYNLDSETFERKISEEKDAVIIDVRTRAEHLQARIPNSKLYDIYQPDFHNKIDTLDKTKTYFVYCHSGSRSKLACSRMLDMGFEKIFNLKSGIASWRGKVEQG